MKAGRKTQYYVYMVRCKYGTYYTGYTDDLKRRVKEHGTARGAKYLRGKGPVELVYVKGYKYYKKAVVMERRIKRLTRKQKETLVGGKRLDKVLSDAGK